MPEFASVSSTEVTMTSGSPSSDRVVGVPDAVLLAIEAHLRQRELRREDLFQRARRLRRLAQGAMTHLHANGSADPEIVEVRKLTADLADWLRREGRGDEPLALDAFQEAVEAILLGAIADGKPLPGPSDLGVDPEPYLLGLGDVVGEVRRRVLDRLGRDDLPGAEADLALMERLTRALLRFDTTRAIVQLKPKQDTARTLLERTRGEVVMARFLSRARPGAPPEAP
jgi:translin